MTPGVRPLASSAVTTVEELAELYRQPSALVRAKKRSGVDEASAAYIGSSPFVLVATAGADGDVDVSPRGGPAGFVRTLDGHHVAIPDLNGNNLIDSIRSIVETGRAGLLFMVPGRDETLRLNGAAWITTAAAVLDLWNRELRRPTTAIVVRADEVFIHCAKAFRRSRLWDPTSWADYASAPDGVGILRAQQLLGDIDEGTVRAALEEGYAADLAADRPAPQS